MEIDKSAPKLFLNACNAEPIKEVKIDICKTSGNQQQCYLQYTLTNVIVTSYSMSGGSGDESPLEEVSLNFEEIKVTYTKFDPKKGNIIETSEALCVAQ